MKNPHVLYGHGKLPVDLPPGTNAIVIEKPQMPWLERPEEAIAASFQSPIGSPTLKALAQTAASACIVICDITRPVPNGLILPPLIRGLLEAGLPAERICVLIATGLHRPNLGEELRELVGSDWVLETVRVENHYALDEATHTKIGTTSRGTPVSLDTRFLEADLKIVTGLIEPHFMAGYSGGRKVIAPGIAHADTIRTFHNTDFMEHPDARNCSLPQNPLHTEQLEIVRMLGDVFAVNTCLDDERRLAFVNFGGVLESHEEAVAFSKRYAEVKIPRKVKCVITSNAGYPQDKNFYQTAKGIVGALGILEKGGSLLIASECSEGLGSPEFCEAQAALVERGIDGFLADARTRPLANIDEWATVKLIEGLRDFKVHLYSKCLTAEQARLTAVLCHHDWEEAVASVLKESQAIEVAVIPEGHYSIPFVELAV